MKPIQIICNKDAEEVMVHWPSGKVEFHGFWSLLRIMWWSIRNGHKVNIVNGPKKETWDEKLLRK